MTITARLQAAYQALTAKQISHHIELNSRIHVSSQYANEAPTIDDSITDYGQVYSGYVWANKAVRKTAEQIAPLSVQVVNRDNEEITGHPITELFAYANDTQSGSDIWNIYIINMLLYGEAFFELVDSGRKIPVEVWPREPVNMNVIPDKTRKYYPTIYGYRYDDDDTIIDPAMVWYNKFYDPNSRFRGLAPIRAVKMGVTIDIFAQAWARKNLVGNYRPDIAIIAPEGVTKSEKTKYLEDFKRQHAGIENATEPVILEYGVTDVKPLNFPPKDTEWLRQREFSRDEVGAVFGMPDEIMGYGRDTYENFDAAFKVWWKYTLKPMIDQRDNSLQQFFTKVRPLLKPGERIQTDTTDIAVLQDDITPKIDNAIKLFQMGVPFNIIDERLGLDIGDFQIEQPEPPPAEQPEPTRSYKQFDEWRKVAINTAHKGKVPNRVFLSDEISRDDSYKLATVLGLCKSKYAVEAVFNNLDDYLSKELLGNGDEIDPARLLLENEFSPQAVEWLMEQVERISRGIQANGNKLPPGSFWAEENKIMAAFLVPFVNIWMDSAVGSAADLLGTVALGLNADVNALAARWAGRHGLNLAKGLNSTTKELSRARLQNWLISDQPYSELVNALHKSISPKWRADLIASTEITNAYHAANEQIAINSDVIKGLVWLTARDERVCPICGPLHGARKNKGGVYPGGLSGPAAHPRCRCGEGFDI